MNTKRKIDETKVLEPVRTAMRGWHRCNYADLDKRVRAAYASLGRLVLDCKLSVNSEAYGKAFREIQALEDRLSVLCCPYDRDKEQAAWFSRLLNLHHDAAAPVQLAP